MSINPKTELTAERVIISGAGVVLVGAMLWMGSQIQVMSREVIEMRVELRSIIATKDSDDRRNESKLADIERRLRALESGQ